MGILTGIIGLGFLLIVSIIAFSIFSDAFLDAFAFFTNEAERLNRVIVPVAGEELCDLTLTVYGAIDVGVSVFDANRLYLGQKSGTNIFGSVFHPEVAQWEWRNCFRNGSGTLLELFPRFHTDNSQSGLLNELAIVITPITTKVKLELERKSDSGLILKTPEFFVSAPTGATLPFTFVRTYNFDNIPISSYDLIICSSSERINDLPFGECFRKRITTTSQFIR